MRVLWTVNSFPPDIANEFGYSSGHAISWVDAMSKRLKDIPNVHLAIATTKGRLTKPVKKEIDGIIYYAIPGYYKVDDSWRQIIDEFKPDIIHAYGTETKQNLIVERVSDKTPVLVSLQGILSEYQNHYYAGIDVSTLFKYLTVHDILTRSSVFAGKRQFIRRSKTEKQIFMNCKFIEGRSTWDRVSALKINPTLRYFFCPRMLRKSFYDANKWDINSVERHTIFVSQGNYPIKGIHFVFEALALVLKKYPDAKLLVTGDSNLGKKNTSFISGKGYLRYLKALSDSLGIGPHIEFVGSKDAEGMAKLYQKAHVAVVSSSIENAPNSLAEAMIIGTPIVSSFVGGNMDMMQHNIDGYMYCYNEPNMLAEYICNIFASDELANSFSYHARKTALHRHNPIELVDKLIAIYREAIIVNN